MNTNPTFNREELELILLTVLKTRNLLFDTVEMKFDKRCLKKPTDHNPTWKGKRGTLPILENIDRLLAIIRMHINMEETLAFYEATGMFDTPCKKIKK